MQASSCGKDLGVYAKYNGKLLKTFKQQEDLIHITVWRCMREASVDMGD